MEGRIIALVGTIGSGKSEFAEMLKGRYIRKGFGSMVANYILQDPSRGEITRENLQYWGDVARQEEGNINFWDDQVKNDLSKNHDWFSGSRTNFIFDSLKTIEQLNYWQKFCLENCRNYPELFVVGVDADERKRFELMNGREREGDSIEWDRFSHANLRDLRGAIMPLRGQYTEACLQYANVVLDNNGSLEEFREKIRETIREYKL